MNKTINVSYFTDEDGLTNLFFPMPKHEGYAEIICSVDGKYTLNGIRGLDYMAGLKRQKRLFAFPVSAETCFIDEFRQVIDSLEELEEAREMCEESNSDAGYEDFYADDTDERFESSCKKLFDDIINIPRFAYA